MCAVQPDDLVKVVLAHSMPSGVQALNVFHFQYKGVSEILDEQVVNDFTLWATEWGGVWAPMAASACRLDEVKVSVSPAATTPFEQIGFSPLSITGTAVSAMLPHAVAAVISRDVRGSSGVSKKFLLGLTEGQQTEGVWDLVSQVLQAVMLAFWELPVDDVLGVDNPYIPIIVNVLKNLVLPIADDGRTLELTKHRRSRAIGQGQ